MHEATEWGREDESLHQKVLYRWGAEENKSHWELQFTIEHEFTPMTVVLVHTINKFMRDKVLTS